MWRPGRVTAYFTRTSPNVLTLTVKSCSRVSGALYSVLLCLCILRTASENSTVRWFSQLQLIYFIFTVLLSYLAFLLRQDVVRITVLTNPTKYLQYVPNLKFSFLNFEFSPVILPNGCSSIFFVRFLHRLKLIFRSALILFYIFMPVASVPDTTVPMEIRYTVHIWERPQKNIAVCLTLTVLSLALSRFWEVEEELSSEALALKQ